MNNKDEVFVGPPWNKIEGVFHRWKWRLAYVFYAILAGFYYLWVSHGADFPFAEQVLVWGAPILVGFTLRILIQTHLQFMAFVQPLAVNSTECAHLLMERLRKTARWKQSALKPITIDVLGVSLHHSRVWMENDFKDFMAEFPGVSVELRLVFVDPAVLKKYEFSPQPVDWAAESQERVEWVHDTLRPFAQWTNNRLRIHVRTIPNLPHWHGILIERRYLFLGRVSWTDGTERFHERPLRLTCAHNGYRVFAVDDRHHGDERVALFRRWMAHYLYGYHDGKVLEDTISSAHNQGVYWGSSGVSQPPG